MSRASGIHDPINLWAGVVVEGGGGGDSNNPNGRASTTASGGGAGGAVATLRAEVACHMEHLRRQAGSPASSLRGWGWLPGPVVHVPAGSAPARMRVRLYSHTDNWKSSIRWAFAQLLPVPPHAQAAPLPELGHVRRTPCVGRGRHGGRGGGGVTHRLCPASLCNRNSVVGSAGAGRGAVVGGVG